MRALTPPRCLVAVLCVLASAACSEASPVGPMTARAVEYRPGWSLDVHRPGTGDRHPVVVALHGCCGDRADLTVLSLALAEGGVVVFNADWGGLSPDGHRDAGVRAACAVEHARSTAAARGGDPARLGLLGWSDGAMIAALVALRATRCPGAPAGPPLPLIGVAGYYGWPGAAPEVGDGRADAFFGGSPSTAGPAWSAGNPYRALAGAPGLRVHLLVGEQDPLRPDGERFCAALAGAGADVRLTVAPYAGDQTLLSPRTAEGRAVVDAVDELLAGGSSESAC